MFCRIALLAFIVFLAAVALLPDTQTHFGFDINPLNEGVSKLPDSFSGPLLANQLLNNADHLFQTEIHGPEAFASFQGKIYTGLGDGRIVEVLPDRLRTVALLDPKKVGQAECAKAYKGQCGRPLGLRFDSRGTLYAVDPFNGVFSINVQTGDSKLFLDSVKLGTKFLDDMVLLEKGNGHFIIYLSDVSTKWHLFDAITCVAEFDRTGRLLKYDTETKQLTVEYENLAFPNGLELTDDKSALLLASITDRLVYKYHLSGPKAGQMAVFIDNLPGEPDNIKRSADKSRETYWVALYTGRNVHKPHFAFDLLGKNGFVKRFILRLQRLTGFLVESAAKLLECECVQKIGFAIKMGFLPNFGACEYGMAVEVDANGQILNSLHSPDGRTCALSEVFELESSEGQRRFLLGSATNPYLGRLTVPKTALQSAKPAARVQVPQVSPSVAVKEEAPVPVKVEAPVPVKVETPSAVPVVPPTKETKPIESATSTSSKTTDKRDEL